LELIRHHPLPASIHNFLPEWIHVTIFHFFLQRVCFIYILSFMRIKNSTHPARKTPATSCAAGVFLYLAQDFTFAFSTLPSASELVSSFDRFSFLRQETKDRLMRSPHSPKKFPGSPTWTPPPTSRSKQHPIRTLVLAGHNALETH
jgi:hypothetical protein